MQRWRVSVQREISRNMAVEVAYNGSRGDRLDATIRQDYLPEQWCNGSNVRDLTQQNLLNANVTNPFFIGNFESLRTSNPALYNQMAGNSFFTSPTIQRHRLLRDFPHMSSGDGLDLQTLPLGRTGPIRSRSASTAGSPTASPRTSSTPPPVRGNHDRRGVRPRADGSGRPARMPGRTGSRPSSSPSSRSGTPSRS